jgi:colanic acid/amylovoran biosynthesis protein
LNILVTDLHNASNKGDAAILEGVVASLKEAFSNPKIKVMSDSVNSCKIINNVNCYPQKTNPVRKYRIIRNLALLYLIFSAFLYNRNIKTFFWDKLVNVFSLENYLEADIIIGTGGSFINDFYSPGNWGRLWGYLFSKIIGKPVFIYSQSIGPLSGVNKKLATYVLNKIDLISVRDEITMDKLISYGVEPSKIYVAADAAFAMDLDKKTSLDKYKLEDDYLFNENELTISVSVRKWNHYNNDNGHREYVNAFAETLDYLIKNKNAQIVFASTCSGFAGYHTDDRVVAFEIIENMEYSHNNVKVLTSELTPQELVEFYKKMDLHIGTRMHSNILALLANTPIVPIEYEFKTRGLMEFFGINDVINVEDISSKKIIFLLNKSLDEYNEMKVLIQNKLPILKSKAKEPAYLIKDFYYAGGQK